MIEAKLIGRNDNSVVVATMIFCSIPYDSDYNGNIPVLQLHIHD